MVTGTTNSGFEFCIEDDTFDDYELLEMLREIDKGNIWLVSDVTTQILGKEQKEALKDHVRKENGKVPASKISEEIGDILSKSRKGKNS